MQKKRSLIDISDRRLRLLITDGLDANGVKILEDSGRFEIEHHKRVESAALFEKVRRADVLVVRSATQVTRELLHSAGQNLKLIARAGVGLDNIDVLAASELGITVVNAQEANTRAAAELTIGLLLSLVRRINEAERSLRGGAWARAELRGFELQGRTLGICGLGRIGSEVARLALALGMQVEAFDTHGTARRRADNLGIRFHSTLLDLLARCDVFTIHIPKSAETIGLIGRDELAHLRKGAYLINAARGGILDEAALLEAVSAGHLSGAALDVFEQEPLSADSPLLKEDKILCTPHIGAATHEAQARVADEIAAKILAFSEGKNHPLV